MINKFEDYVDGTPDKRPIRNFIYSPITAMAVMNPSFFDFLETPRERYTYPDRSFYQAFVLELNNQKQIKIKSSLEDINGISIEHEWLELKNCIKAANHIRNKFIRIDEIIFDTDMLIVVSDNQRFIFRDKKPTDNIEHLDLETLLGFTSDDIYMHEHFEHLITEWFKLVREYLKPAFIEHLDFFLDDMYDKEVGLNWSSYLTYQLKGLGRHIPELSKLYYNKLYDFMQDLSYDKDAFRDYDLFVAQWYEYKKKTLNNDVIYSLYNNNKNEKNRIKQLKNILIKEYSLSNKKHFRFDPSNKLEIKELPNVKDFKHNFPKNIEEKFWLNNNKSLILVIKNDGICFKLSIGFENIAPSNIIIKHQYNEEDGFKLFGRII